MTEKKARPARHSKERADGWYFVTIVLVIYAALSMASLLGYWEGLRDAERAHTVR